MLSHRGQGRGPNSHRSIDILRMRDATSNSPSSPSDRRLPTCDHARQAVAAEPH